jgi:hypothetical protein
VAPQNFKKMSSKNNKRFLAWKNKWSDPNGMDEFEYISYNVHPEDFLITKEMLFPRIIEFDGGIFLHKYFSLELYQSMLPRNKTDIEKDLNALKVFELFEGCVDSISEETFEEIGKLIEQAWTYYFKSKFPGKNILVELIIDESNYGPIVRFFQQEQ